MNILFYNITEETYFTDNNPQADKDNQREELISNLIDTFSYDTNTYLGKPLTQEKVETMKLSPVTIAVPLLVNNHPSTKLMRTLLDSGGSCTILNRKSLPKGCVPSQCTPTNTVTAAGTFNMKQYVWLEDITLPEFNRHVNYKQLKAYIFDQPDCQYDIIGGRDLLTLAQVQLKFDTHTIQCDNKEISMKEPGYWENPMNLYLTLIDDEYLDNEQIDESYATILPSKYEKVDTKEVAQQQKHLDEEKRRDLAHTLEKYPILFNGKLGEYPHKKVHLDLKPDAKPFHAKAYAVPHINHKIFKDECDRLCEVGVLEPTGATEWAAGTFITPKKDGRVRWVSDFRMLNQYIRRRKYPLPKIQDILNRRKGYKFFTKIDISMQYYSFVLDDESSELCTIVTPFGKYKYKRLPMGVCQSADIAQEVMEHILRGLEEVEVYIDDIGIFSNDWESHMKSVNEVLHRLQTNGLTVNPLKCEWAIQETDWLGYWLAPWF